jgi:hypothetical protein
MGCGCGKKNAGSTIHFMGKDSNVISNPVEWGPILWKYLHCLAEKTGFSNNKVADADQANCMEIMIGTLPLILPCTECQAHAAAYLAAHPLPALKELQGATLRETLRNWLFLFHNQVRLSKGQPILIETAEQCAATYTNCFVPKCEYSFFVQSVAYAVRQGWVRIDQWRKWYSTSEKARLILGNVVV